MKRVRVVDDDPDSTGAVRALLEAEGYEVSVVEGRDVAAAPLLATLEELLAVPVGDVREAMDRAAQLLAQVFGVDKVDIWLPRGDLLCAEGVSDTPMGHRQVALGLDRFARGEQTCTSDILDSGAPYLTGHAEVDERVHPGVKGPLGVRSMAGVPLEVAGKRRGVLLLADARPERFTDDDLRFLRAVAHWVGLVLRQAELLEAAASRAEAEAAVKARDEFLSIASHELRNPLAGLRGTAELLQRRARRGQVAPEHLAASLGTLVSSVDRLDRLLEDLLDTSRLRTGQLALRPQALDLVELVREAAEQARERSEGHEIRVEVACDRCVVRADPDRVHQVVDNLLENALKYSPAGGEVAISLEHEGTEVILRVRDQGIGLPPGTEEVVFEPFRRAPNAAEANIPGLGLGLYVCRQIAEAHGGTLRAESAGEGRGSTFLLRLPAVHAAATAGTSRPG